MSHSRPDHTQDDEIMEEPDWPDEWEKVKNALSKDKFNPEETYNTMLAEFSIHKLKAMIDVSQPPLP